MNKPLVIAIPLVALAALSIGLGTGYWYAANKTPGQENSVGSPRNEDTVLFYRNPMKNSHQMKSVDLSFHYCFFKGKIYSSF